MLESNKKEWKTPEFKKLEIPDELVKPDGLSKIVKELHGIYQELHEINKTLKKIK